LETTTSIQHERTGPAPELAEWEQRFRELSNADPELQAHGKYYSCSFLLDMGEHRFVVKTHQGKVDDISVDPGDLEEPYQFAIRASPETWTRFSQPVPPPMYHGIWAASFRAGMRLEGDLLVLMQNLRALTRHLELLRQTGVPVGGRRI